MINPSLKGKRGVGRGNSLNHLRPEGWWDLWGVLDASWKFLKAFFGAAWTRLWATYLGPLGGSSGPLGRLVLPPPLTSFLDLNGESATRQGRVPQVAYHHQAGRAPQVAYHHQAGRAPQVATCPASGGPLGGPKGVFERLGCLGDSLEAFWGFLGASWRPLGAVWALLGALLGRSWKP